MFFIFQSFKTYFILYLLTLKIKSFAVPRDWKLDQRLWQLWTVNTKTIAYYAGSAQPQIPEYKQSGFFLTEAMKDGNYGAWMLRIHCSRIYQTFWSASLSHNIWLLAQVP
jgi:hypothetical protein